MSFRKSISGKRRKPIPKHGSSPAQEKIEVRLCCDDAMLTEAYRLRYRVYCEELGRESPYANHDTRTIKDPLDNFGVTFIAVTDGETVGTIRGNLPAQGPLGILESFYGMRASVHHPKNTAALTKFVVSKSSRGGAVAMKLIAEIRRYGARHNVKECYIDCTPELVPFYRFFGFEIVGDQFMHYENGPSYPMMLNGNCPKESQGSGLRRSSLVDGITAGSR